jgi:hypothetical protein
MPDDAKERALALAAQWEAESQGMREQSVREGLHPALASGHREASLLAKCAGDLRATIGSSEPRPGGDMYRSAYFRVQEILDDVLGPEEEDGAGEGIASDVALLARRCKAAEAEVLRLKGMAAMRGMLGADL